MKDLLKIILLVLILSILVLNCSVVDVGPVSQSLNTQCADEQPEAEQVNNVQPGAGQELAFTIPDVVVKDNILTASAFSGVRKNATYCYLEISIHDLKGKQISPTSFAESLTAGAQVIATVSRDIRTLTSENPLCWVYVYAREITDETGTRVATPKYEKKRVQYIISTPTPTPTQTPTPTPTPTQTPTPTPTPTSVEEA